MLYTEGINSCSKSHIEHNLAKRKLFQRVVTWYIHITLRNKAITFFTLERDIEGAVIPRIERFSSQVDPTHKVLR